MNVHVAHVCETGTAVTQAAVRFVNCTTVANQSVLFWAPTVGCAPLYVRGMVYALLVLVGLVLPLTLVERLWRAGPDRRAADGLFEARWGFFYESYRSECFWWCGVDVVQRCVLVLIANLMATSPVEQVGLMGTVHGTVESTIVCFRAGAVLSCCGGGVVAGPHAGATVQGRTA